MNLPTKKSLTRRRNRNYSENKLLCVIKSLFFEENLSDLTELFLQSSAVFLWLQRSESVSFSIENFIVLQTGKVKNIFFLKSTTALNVYVLSLTSNCNKFSPNLLNDFLPFTKFSFKIN